MHPVLRDVRNTLVPDMRGPHGPLPPLMLVLTVTTGLVDAFSYLVLGRVFVANMTGNVVFSAFAVAGAPGFSLVASLVALAAFLAGALAGGRMVHRSGLGRGRMLFGALAVETVLVAAAYIIEQLADTPDDSAVRYPLIALLGAGLGLQNAAARALAVPDLTTTVLTLTITGIAADSPLAGGPGSRFARRALSTAAMLLGALVGALAVLHGQRGLPLLLAALLLAAAAAVTYATSRNDPPWTAAG